MRILNLPGTGGGSGGAAGSITFVAVPATLSSAGTPGQFAYANGVMYACVGANAWIYWAVNTS